MATNFKGELLTLIAQRRISPPEWKSTMVGGEPHCPIWQTSVKVGSLSALSAHQPSKRESEQDAAQKMLEMMGSRNETEEIRERLESLVQAGKMIKGRNRKGQVTYSFLN